MLKPIAPTRPELSTEIEISPAFHDLDPMNIVWHGHYIKYLELARCALLARLLMSSWMSRTRRAMP